MNAVTELDAYPLPNIQDILRKLRKAKFISTLDLKSAYHQVPLAEEARTITAFTVPGLGLLQFRRMPYELMNDPATFQRLIDQVLGPELEPYVYAYLNDIIIVAETFEKHKKCLRMVLERLAAAGLTLNAAKCVFCKSEVAYLWFLVNRDGTRPNPARIEPIKNYPVPRNLKALQRFRGTTSWYRRFIPNYVTIAEPLTNLTKKNQRYEYLEEQQTKGIRAALRDGHDRTGTAPPRSERALYSADGRECRRPTSSAASGSRETGAGDRLRESCANTGGAKL